MLSLIYSPVLATIPSKVLKTDRKYFGWSVFHFYRGNIGYDDNRSLILNMGPGWGQNIHCSCSETWQQFKFTAELIIKGDKLEKNQSRPLIKKPSAYSVVQF